MVRNGQILINILAIWSHWTISRFETTQTGPFYDKSPKKYAAQAGQHCSSPSTEELSGKQLFISFCLRALWWNIVTIKKCHQKSYLSKWFRTNDVRLSSTIDDAKFDASDRQFLLARDVRFGVHVVVFIIVFGVVIVRRFNHVLICRFELMCFEVKMSEALDNLCAMQFSATGLFRRAA